MTPLVSVIVPTYNYGHYIAKAIHSILDQDYPNIEVIVVDDGSVDDTQAVLTAFSGRIRVFRQGNRGASAARNRGLSEASGEYISFLDADDYYLPENISSKVNYLLKHPEYKWCYSDWAWVDEQDVITSYGHEAKRFLVHDKLFGDVFSASLRGLLLQTNMFLFHRKVLDQVGGFDEGLSTLEDYDLFLRASHVFPIGYVDKVLCHLYAHSGSLGTGLTKKKGYYHRWLMNRKVLRLFPLEAANSRDWRRIQSDVYRNLANFALAENCPRRALVLLRASLRYWRWQAGVLLLAVRVCWRLA